MTRRQFAALAAIAAAGLAIQLYLAFHYFGNGDLFGFEDVGQRFVNSPFHAYAGGLPWVYPPGYMPWLAVAIFLRNHTDMPFHGLVQLLPIAANLALACLIYVYLGWKNCGNRYRLVAFALVMLGPVFIAISGYHGQIDAVAITPAVLGLMLWERMEGGNRALWVGLLLGLGAVTKTVPLLLVLPLLVSVRSRKEAFTLVAAAVAVPVLAAIPFYLAEPDAFHNASSYAGVPGRGGLSLLADPAFGAHRLQSIHNAFFTTPNGLADFLAQNATVWTLALMAGLGAFLYRFRPSPLDGVILLWLVIYALSPNFLAQYLVWSIPFLLMAGYLKQVALLQLAMVIPLLIVYVHPLDTPVFFSWVYVAMMILLWATWVICLVIFVRRIVASSDGRRGQVLPPLSAYDN